MGENIVKRSPENKDNEAKKLNYDELEKAAQNMSAQLQNLANKYRELQEMHQELLQNRAFLRLEWLWKIINSDKMSETFVSKCKEEFEEVMFPSVTEEEND